jgi:hypothetical protein
MTNDETIDAAVELSREIFDLFRDRNASPELAINVLISVLAGTLQSSRSDNLEANLEACIKALRGRVGLVSQLADAPPQKH